MKSRTRGKWLLIGGVAILLGAAGVHQALMQIARHHAFTPLSLSLSPRSGQKLSPFQQKLMTDLDRQVRAGIRYRDGYYSGGEPPANLGVCTDVVIRSFRAAGVDLQQQVAADINAVAPLYHISRPDRNIDHRRCRNLIVFFRRHARALPTEGPDADWQPGDIVFWDTANRGGDRVDHIGMIATHRDSSGTPTIIHHWPGLPVSETSGLYRFPVRAHFRW